MHLRVLQASLVLALACGGPPTTPVKPPAAARPAFAGAQWVPGKPTYLLASHHVRDAQRSARDLIDSFGMLWNVQPSQISQALQQLLAVDALSSDAVAAIGVDADGPISVFSEDLNPTMVVHLTSAEQFAAFIDHQRERGLVTQSQVVDGTEIYSVKVDRTRISWAIANDTLWIHFGLSFAHDDGTTWFTSSHTPSPPTWGAAWAWADRAATHAGLTGFADLRQLISSVAERLPDAIACAQLAAPLGRISVAVEGDGRHAAGRLGIELGPAAAGVAKAILPPPAGWADVAKQAPLAAQWNLDLDVVQAWFAPCARGAHLDLGWIKELGVRSGRAILQSLDISAMTGTGVVSADLAGRTYFAHYLDQIPMRSTLEKDRKFGPYAGHSVAIPFVATVDYVLTDQLALAGMGDGLLARAVGTGPGTGGAIAALDVRPDGLPAGTWEWLIGHVPGFGRPPAELLERFMHWQEGHLGLTVEGDQLVFAASGNRR